MVALAKAAISGVVRWREPMMRAEGSIGRRTEVSRGFAGFQQITTETAAHRVDNPLFYSAVVLSGRSS